MIFKNLDCYELLRLQRGTEDIVYYPNGKLMFRRDGAHSVFFYDNAKLAAELDLIGASKLLTPTYALNTFSRRQSLNFDTNFMVGEYELTALEILLLCQVVLKKYYGKNVDICRYLKHLPIFIPWQSLTYPLRRFSVTQRKDILSKFGKLITTYTESANQIRQEMNISIF